MTRTLTPWDSFTLPLRDALPLLIGSIEHIAPEKSKELDERIRRVTLIVDDAPGFVFRSRGDSDPREVRASLVGLEFLWASVYGSVAAYQRSKGLESDVLNFADYPDTAAGEELLRFALNDRLGPEPPKHALPDWLPRPTFYDPSTGTDATLVELATELLACAIAWILHHELGHVHLNHLDEPLYSPSEELAADKAASDWFLSDIMDELIVLKRSLGIALAVSTVAALELRNGHRHDLRKYPPTGERVLSALSHPVLGTDHQSYDLAAFTLKIHLDSVGITVDDFEAQTAYDLLYEYCIAINRAQRR